MSDTNNGGPAFPVQDAASWQAHGISARDWFAGLAMPAVYADAMHEARQGSGLMSDDQWRIGLARDAYALADAMLKARGGAQ